VIDGDITHMREMIRNSGNEPTVIHYLETPPTHDELVKLIAEMGMTTIGRLIRMG
jgi:arsenate reductase-like glutaredoxin family protein